MISRGTLLTAALIAFSALLSCGRAETLPVQQKSNTIWEGLRSAIVYVRVPSAGKDQKPVEVDWTPAWISDSQRERLYWYSPKGVLIKRIEIERSQPRGSVSLPITYGSGDYRLVIPGYSFRKYGVVVPTTYKTVIEPEKLHFSMEVGKGQEFWSGPITSAQFHLKSHQEKARFLLSTESSPPQTISHSASRKYRDHEYIDIQGQNSQFMFTVTDGGKFSFWLDRAPNVFSQRAEHWFEPDWATGEAIIAVSNRVIGETTDVGTYTEFAPLPIELQNFISEARPSIVHSYIFEDVMFKHIARDNANNRALLDLGVSQLYGLLSRTTRDSLPASTARSADFLDEYLRQRFANGLPLNIIAFVDEPNLRYQSYEAYETYHLRLAETVRRLRQELGIQLKIAAPESSRMANGPTNSPRRFQSGISWTEKLLSRHWDSVDVISWHMWQHRYLEALDQYPETILDVAELNALLAERFEASPKELSISQTNLGSGPNTSTYQQNTYYAGLWWASVVAQSIGTGELDSLIWFKAVDEGPYGKGLLERQNGKLTRKPIAKAMSFVNETLLPKTLTANSSAHEVDIAAMRSESGQVSILCVNKSRRDYSLTIDTIDVVLNSVTILGPDHHINTIPLSNAQQIGSSPIQIPPESICQLRGHITD